MAQLSSEVEINGTTATTVNLVANTEFIVISNHDNTNRVHYAFDGEDATTSDASLPPSGTPGSTQTFYFKASNHVVSVSLLLSAVATSDVSVYAHN